MLGDGNEMPSVKTADQGSLLWGSFPFGISFLQIIMAHVRDVLILILSTLLQNLDANTSAAMISSGAVIYPVGRIIWKRKPREPPDKSNDIGFETHPILSFGNIGFGSTTTTTICCSHELTCCSHEQPQHSLGLFHGRLNFEIDVERSAIAVFV